MNLRAGSILLAWCCYFLSIMEWLFFITKPSFLTLAPIREHVMALFVTPLLILSYAGISFFLISLVAAILRRIFPSVPDVNGFVPAFVLATSALLLIDNFTYTMLGIGVVSSQGGRTYLYLALFLLIVLALLRFFHRASGDRGSIVNG